MEKIRCKEPCDEHKEMSKMISQAIDELMKFRLLWYGNGKVGYKDKIERMWENHMRIQKTNQGLFDWMFRAVLMIGITYIAVKLGIK